MDTIQELQNYKDMWEELKRISIEIPRRDLIKQLEQKYFPAYKKTITFTIEAPTEHYLGTAINDFEMFWANYNGVKGHCASYSYKNN